MTMLRHTLVNHFLEYSAQRYPYKVALIHQGKRLTYAEIDSMANRVAATLIDRGVERGDRVAVFMDNSVEAVISIFAALKAGAAFMIINHTTKAEKLEYIMNNSRAKALITQISRTDVIQQVTSPYLKTIIMAGPHKSFNHSTIQPFNRSNLTRMPYEEIVNSIENKTITSKCIDLDLASVIYTSGSTGRPKGVMLSHLNMISAAHSITTYLENSGNDIIINVLPMSFDYGLYQILMYWFVGFEKNQIPSHDVLSSFNRLMTPMRLFTLILRVDNILASTGLFDHDELAMDATDVLSNNRNLHFF